MGWLPPIMLLNLFALAAYVYVAVLAVARNRRSLLNWSCAAVLVALAIWCVEAAVRGNPDASYASVRAIGRLGSLGWCTFASLNLLFTLALTRQYRALKARVTYVLLAGVPLVFIIAHWHGALVARYAPTWFGWTIIWTQSAWPVAFHLYYLSASLLSWYLLVTFALRTPRARERERAWLIIGTGGIAVVLGTVTDVVLPMVPGTHFPEIASLIALVWAWGLYRAITRYGLMSVTVQAAADDILAAMADSVLLLSPRGTVVICNQSFLDLTGRCRAAVIGARAADFFTVPEALARALDAVAREGAASSVELDVARDGGGVTVSLSGRMMREKRGDPVGVVLVLHDLTELRAAQAGLARHERLAALAQVAGAVAHEVRNPLGAIRNAAYYLKRLSNTQFDSKAARHLDIIDEQTQRANDVITSLLEFARGRPCEPHECRIGDIVAGTLERLQLPDGIRVETDLASDLPPVVADAAQISVVLQNLVLNASEAMHARGAIRIAGAIRGGAVRVNVHDTGGGIRSENMARLFEPLFSTKAFGVGLGLPTAKAYVEANGGTISVETEAGEGTTFSFSLPVAGA